MGSGLYNPLSVICVEAFVLARLLLSRDGHLPDAWHPMTSSASDVAKAMQAIQHHVWDFHRRIQPPWQQEGSLTAEGEPRCEGRCELLQRSWC